MSQDSKVFFRIFFGIGLVLIFIFVVVFYNQFIYSKDVIYIEGVIVDIVWYFSYFYRMGKDGLWYFVVVFRLMLDYMLIFNLSIGSDFYEDSEGDKVNVYYFFGYFEKVEINNLWVNFLNGGLSVLWVLFLSLSVY